MSCVRFLLAIFPTRIPCKSSARDGQVLINIAAFEGFVPVNVSQSTRADVIPSVTSNASQEAGQAAISDGNNGLISGDVSEHASTSGCPISVGESQLSDENMC